MRKIFILLACLALSFMAIQVSGLIIKDWVIRTEYSGDDQAFDSAVDDDGNVYVAGIRYIPGQDYDFLVLKYDPAGNLKWARTFNGSGDGADTARAIYYYGSGVYVAGETKNDSGNTDIIAIRYSLDGNEEWVRQFDFDGGDDAANDIIVCRNGVYLATEAWNERLLRSDFDALVMKYDTTGYLLWLTPYDSGYNEYARAIDVDYLCNPVITGMTEDNDDADYLTAKFSAGSGALQWAKMYDGPAVDFSTDIALDVRLDPCGHAWVTGLSIGDTTGADIATIRYNSVTGAAVCSTRYNGPGNGDDYGIALDVDQDCNAYLTGQACLDQGTDDYGIVTIKYTSGCVPVWTSIYPGAAADCDEAGRDIEVCSGGSIFVTGNACNNSGNSDYFTAEYAADDGYMREMDLYDGPYGGDDYAYTVSCAMQDHVFVAGGSQDDAVDADIATIKYVSIECLCTPGDANGNDIINILDVSYLINYLYKGGPAPTPYALCSGDPNGDCIINILDVTYMINFLYTPGNPPPVTCEDWAEGCGLPIRK